MSVLITGGAGYIGSHAAHALVARGEDVVILDNLSSGRRELVPASAEFVHGDISDGALLSGIFRRREIREIMHFAASISAPESVVVPLRYYENNVAASRTLIETCIQSDVKSFIYSSTAAVYGEPACNPVDETAPTRPINPYGRSKLAVEWMLEDAATANGLHHVILRYFNVAGVDSRGRGGQPSRNVDHLIKRTAQVALGRRDHLDIFGADYPTRDGTPVRDYIHVYDLVEAHILALDYLRGGGMSTVYNCGYGHGASVLEVVAAFERVTGKALAVRHVPRRAGDAAEVVADSTRLRSRHKWTPRYDSLDVIVRSALEWESRQGGD
jgi:UDP-glucose 4-epimerase